MDLFLLKQHIVDLYILKVSHDTIFTIIATLSIYFLGFGGDRLKKYLDKNKELKETKAFYKFNLDEIIDNYLKQLQEGYRSSFEDRNIDQGIPATPPIILSGNFDRINNIDKKKLNDSIKNKEALSIILNNVEAINHLLQVVNDYHEKIKQESNYYRRPLQEMINEYSDYLADFYKEYCRSAPNEALIKAPEFVNQVSSTLDKFNKNFQGKNSLKEIYNEIRAVQKAGVGNNFVENDEISFKIIKLGKDISFQYNYLNNVFHDFTNNYKNFYDIISKAKNHLEEARKQINW